MPPDIEQFHHPRSARTPAREALLAGLTGAVVEIGAGDGGKFRHYPATVTEITVVEPDALLCQTAREGCAGSAVPVRIQTGGLDRLPLPGGSADAVVCSLVLCCAPRLSVTLGEVMRVLRPGGELRFYEHVRSANPFVAFTERIIGPIWAQAAGGCHPARDTVRAIREAGFVIDQVKRLDFDRISHVLGIARRL
ncbi:class I SAM-dependent methyltransferase [Nonomuraea typhae]|uniref:class I SAM-dependent methyltransferase n=1 Tax=Nonomuraea typhae TaxID=2603600 RepID=UPI0012FAA52F|nr:class I SAM-dependent methyltransferase [Nonomuraea typhae]